MNYGTSVGGTLDGPMDSTLLYCEQGMQEAKAGNFSKADALFQKSIEERKKKFGAESEAMTIVLIKYAEMLVEKGDLKKAFNCLEQCVDINSKCFGPGHESIADLLYYLSHISKLRKNYELAEADLVECLNIRRNIYGSDHDLVVKTEKTLLRLRSNELGLISAKNQIRLAANEERLVSLTDDSQMDKLHSEGSKHLTAQNSESEDVLPPDISIERLYAIVLDSNGSYEAFPDESTEDANFIELTRQPDLTDVALEAAVTRYVHAALFKSYQMILTSSRRGQLGIDLPDGGNGIYRVSSSDNALQTVHTKLDKLLTITKDLKISNQLHKHLQFAVNRAHALSYYESKDYPKAVKYLNMAVSGCPTVAEDASHSSVVVQSNNEDPGSPPMLFFVGGLVDTLVILAESYSALGKRDDSLHSARLAVNTAHQHLENYHNIKQFNNRRNRYSSNGGGMNNLGGGMELGPVLDGYCGVVLAYCTLAAELEKSGLGHLSVDWYSRAIQTGTKFDIDPGLIKDLGKLSELAKLSHVPGYYPTVTSVSGAGGAGGGGGTSGPVMMRKNSRPSDISKASQAMSSIGKSEVTSSAQGRQYNHSGDIASKPAFRKARSLESDGLRLHFEVEEFRDGNRGNGGAKTGVNQKPQTGLSEAASLYDNSPTTSPITHNPPPEYTEGNNGYDADVFYDESQEHGEEYNDDQQLDNVSDDREADDNVVLPSAVLEQSGDGNFEMILVEGEEDNPYQSESSPHISSVSANSPDRRSGTTQGMRNRTRPPPVLHQQRSFHAPETPVDDAHSDARSGGRRPRSAMPRMTLQHDGGDLSSHGPSSPSHNGGGGEQNSYPRISTHSINPHDPDSYNHHFVSTTSPITPHTQYNTSQFNLPVSPLPRMSSGDSVEDQLDAPQPPQESSSIINKRPNDLLPHRRKASRPLLQPHNQHQHPPQMFFAPITTVEENNPMIHHHTSNGGSHGYGNNTYDEKFGPPNSVQLHRQMIQPQPQQTLHDHQHPHQTHYYSQEPMQSQFSQQHQEQPIFIPQQQQQQESALSRQQRQLLQDSNRIRPKSAVSKLGPAYSSPTRQYPRPQSHRGNRVATNHPNAGGEYNYNDTATTPWTLTTDSNNMNSNNSNNHATTRDITASASTSAAAAAPSSATIDAAVKALVQGSGRSIILLRPLADASNKADLKRRVGAGGVREAALHNRTQQQRQKKLKHSQSAGATLELVDGADDDYQNRRENKDGKWVNDDGDVEDRREETNPPTHNENTRKTSPSRGKRRQPKNGSPNRNRQGYSSATQREALQLEGATAAVSVEDPLQDFLDGLDELSSDNLPAAKTTKRKEKHQPPVMNTRNRIASQRPNPKTTKKSASAPGGILHRTPSVQTVKRSVDPTTKAAVARAMSMQQLPRLKSSASMRGTGGLNRFNNASTTQIKNNQRYSNTEDISDDDAAQTAANILALRALNETNNEKVHRLAQAYFPFIKGMRVEAKYLSKRLGSRSRWYPGFILSANFVLGLYSIKYDNGETEESVYVDDIRLPNVRATSAGGSSTHGSSNNVKGVLKFGAGPVQDEIAHVRHKPVRFKPSTAAAQRAQNDTDMQASVLHVFAQSAQRELLRKAERVAIKNENAQTIQALGRGYVVRQTFSSIRREQWRLRYERWSQERLETQQDTLSLKQQELHFKIQSEDRRFTRDRYSTAFRVASGDSYDEPTDQQQYQQLQQQLQQEHTQKMCLLQEKHDLLGEERDVVLEVLRTQKETNEQRIQRETAELLEKERIAKELLLKQQAQEKEKALEQAAELEKLHEELLRSQEEIEELKRQELANEERLKAIEIRRQKERQEEKAREGKRLREKLEAEKQKSAAAAVVSAVQVAASTLVKQRRDSMSLDQSVVNAAANATNQESDDAVKRLQQEIVDLKEQEEQRMHSLEDVLNRERQAKEKYAQLSRDLQYQLAHEAQAAETNKTISQALLRHNSAVSYVSAAVNAASVSLSRSVSPSRSAHSKKTITHTEIDYEEHQRLESALDKLQREMKNMKTEEGKYKSDLESTLARELAVKNKLAEKVAELESEILQYSKRDREAAKEALAYNSANDANQQQNNGESDEINAMRSKLRSSMDEVRLLKEIEAYRLQMAEENSTRQKQLEDAHANAKSRQTYVTDRKKSVTRASTGILAAAAAAVAVAAVEDDGQANTGSDPTSITVMPPSAMRTPSQDNHTHSKKVIRNLSFKVERDELDIDDDDLDQIMGGSSYKTMGGQLEEDDDVVLMDQHPFTPTSTNIGKVSSHDNSLMAGGGMESSVISIMESLTEVPIQTTGDVQRIVMDIPPICLGSVSISCAIGYTVVVRIGSRTLTPAMILPSPAAVYSSTFWLKQASFLPTASEEAILQTSSSGVLLPPPKASASPVVHVDYGNRTTKPINHQMFVFLLPLFNSEDAAASTDDLLAHLDDPAYLVSKLEISLLELPKNDASHSTAVVVHNSEELPCVFRTVIGGDDFTLMLNSDQWLKMDEVLHAAQYMSLPTESQHLLQQKAGLLVRGSTIMLDYLMILTIKMWESYVHWAVQSILVQGAIFELLAAISYELASETPSQQPPPAESNSLENLASSSNKNNNNVNHMGLNSASVASSGKISWREELKGLLQTGRDLYCAFYKEVGEIERELRRNVKDWELDHRKQQRSDGLSFASSSNVNKMPVNSQQEGSVFEDFTPVNKPNDTTAPFAPSAPEIVLSENLLAISNSVNHVLLQYSVDLDAATYDANGSVHNAGLSSHRKEANSAHSTSSHHHTHSADGIAVGGSTASVPIRRVDPMKARSLKDLWRTQHFEHIREVTHEFLASLHLQAINNDVLATADNYLYSSCTAVFEAGLRQLQTFDWKSWWTKRDAFIGAIASSDPTGSQSPLEERQLRACETVRLLLMEAEMRMYHPMIISLPLSHAVSPIFSTTENPMGIANSTTATSGGENNTIGGTSNRFCAISPKVAFISPKYAAVRASASTVLAPFAFRKDNNTNNHNPQEAANDPSPTISLFAEVDRSVCDDNNGELDDDLYGISRSYIESPIGKSTAAYNTGSVSDPAAVPSNDLQAGSTSPRPLSPAMASLDPFFAQVTQLAALLVPSEIKQPE